MTTTGSERVTIYRRLSQAAGYLLLSFDADGVILEASDNAPFITSYSPEELIGNPITFLTHPGWQHRLEHLLAETGHENALEFPAITRTGDTRWIAMTLITSGEGDAAYYACLRDVSNYKDLQTRYDVLIENTGDPVLLLDANGRCTYANMRASRLLMRAPEQLADLSFRDLLPREEREDEMALLDDVLGGNELVGKVLHLERGDGVRISVTLDMRLVRDGVGKPAHVQCLLHPRIEPAENVPPLESPGSQLADTAVLMFDHDMRFMLSEGDILSRYNFPPEAIEGKLLHDVFPDYAAKVLEPHYRRALAGQQSAFELHTGNRTFIGRVYPVFGGDREVFAGLVVTHEVTEFLQVRDQLSGQIQQLTILRDVDAELSERLSTDYVLEMGLDASMRLSGADAGFIAILDDSGKPEPVWVTGNIDRDRLDPYLQSTDSPASRALKERRTITTTGKEGGDGPGCRGESVACMALPLLSRNNIIGVLHLETRYRDTFREEHINFVELVAGRLAVALDNARLYQQIEQRLEEIRAAHDRVSHLEQLKTDMIRIASHDLRNPLAAIGGNLELVRLELDTDEPEIDDVIEKVNEVDHNVRRMQKIIYDLLSLERIEQMAEEANYDVLDLREPVQKAFENTTLGAPDLRQFTLAVPAEAVHVSGDPVQLEEAVTNLIGNAVKYTPDDGQIDVRLWVEDGRACFEVKDNGFGIREEQQARLFQPFYRARTAETRSIEGTGLGLHLVKNIVERHHGEIEFKSSFGEGSTFGFWAPLAEDA
jgi:PAS domain S-box-containing protein